MNYVASVLVDGEKLAVGGSLPLQMYEQDRLACLELTISALADALAPHLAPAEETAAMDGVVHFSLTVNGNRYNHFESRRAIGLAYFDVVRKHVSYQLAPAAIRQIEPAITWTGPTAMPVINSVDSSTPDPRFGPDITLGATSPG